MNSESIIFILWGTICFFVGYVGCLFVNNLLSISKKNKMRLLAYSHLRPNNCDISNWEGCSCRTREYKDRLGIEWRECLNKKRIGKCFFDKRNKRYVKEKN